MASISIDTSEVRALVADMSGVDARLRPDVAAVVKKGATNIKGELTSQMKSSRHFKGFADIGYDMVDSFEAEIGPNKGGPGSGANIAYFGTSRGGGTVEDPENALEREMPAFEEHMADIAERAIFG